MPSGYPSTDDITDTLLKGEKFHYHDQLKDRFFLTENRGKDKMVELATGVCASKPFRGSTYESTYNNIVTIQRNRKTRESPYHIYAKSLDEIINSMINRIFGNQYHYLEMVDGSGDLIDETYGLVLKYISNGVRQIILEKRSHVNTSDNFEKISLYKKLLATPSVSGLDLFTLNHDTLLEDYFYANSINYYDYSLPKNEGERLESFSKDYGRADGIPVALFKLHGSINWFEFRDSKKAGQIFFGIPVSGDNPVDWYYSIPKIENVTDVMSAMGFASYDSNDPRRSSDTTQGMIIGTDAKLGFYPQYPYLPLLFMFYTRLLLYDKIIVIGYGFNDAAITNLLLWWREVKPADREIFLVSIEPDQYDVTQWRMDKYFNRGIEKLDINNIIEFINI